MVRAWRGLTFSNLSYSDAAVSAAPIATAPSGSRGPSAECVWPAPRRAICDGRLRGNCTQPTSGLIRTDVSDGSKGEILAGSRCFPLCPRKRTQIGHRAMSEKCQEATSQKEAAIIVRSDPRIGGRMLQVHVRKDDIRTAHAVDIPLSPLPEGAARLHLKLFGLSANNVTYAAGGEGAYGWWDFFPGPPGWGVLPCWGIADVINSRAPSLAIGTRYYGYFPIAETLDVLPINVSDRGFADGSPHRANKAAVSNQYYLTTADTLYDPQFEPKQLLLLPTFVSACLLA